MQFVNETFICWKCTDSPLLTIHQTTLRSGYRAHIKLSAMHCLLLPYSEKSTNDAGKH